MKQIIEKYSVPTKYDLARRGQICVVNEDKPVYYIQVADDENHATWVKFGDLLEIVFKDSINDEHFIMNSLDMYNINIRR